MNKARTAVVNSDTSTFEVKALPFYLLAVIFALSIAANAALTF